MNLTGRSLLTLHDLSRDELTGLLDLSAVVKRQRRSGARHQRFAGLTLAMLYEKPSTRTRSAFATAFGEEGGFPVMMNKDELQLGAKESIEDTARVFGRMYDAIQYRGYAQETVEILHRYAGIPVYNGLTDSRHPTQVLADLLTIREHYGALDGVSLAYVGDARNNVATSLMIGCSMTGVGCTLVAPRELQPDPGLVDECRNGSGTPLTLSEDLDAVDGADVVYTDVWASMGEEDRETERLQLLAGYQVNDALMRRAAATAIFMHDLPAVKGNEVTAAVFEAPYSMVWEQAENRKHTAKALMLATLVGDA